MNKIGQCFLLFSAIVFLSCADEKEKEKPEEQYVINGDVTGFPDGTMVYLKNLSTDANIDSSVVRNNSFNMRGKLENPPEQLWLTSQLEEKFIYTNLLIGNDSITIEADVEDFPWNVAARGSKIQEEYVRARDRTRKLDMERDSLTTYFIGLDAEERQKVGKELWQRINKIDSITFSKKVEYLKNNNTYLSLIELGYLKDRLPRDTVRKVFNQFPEELRNSKYGNVLKVFLEKETITIGDSFYDFEAINQNDEKIQFSTIQDTSKFTLIDFTSAFCGPCIQAADELVAVDRDLKDSLTIVSFSGDPKKESWLKGVERDNVTWNSLWDGKGRFSETAIHYGVGGFPTFVLINPQGKVVDKWTGYSEGSLKERLTKHM